MVSAETPRIRRDVVVAMSLDQPLASPPSWCARQPLPSSVAIWIRGKPRLMGVALRHRSFPGGVFSLCVLFACFFGGSHVITVHFFFGRGLSGVGIAALHFFKYYYYDHMSLRLFLGIPFFRGG